VGPRREPPGRKKLEEKHGIANGTMGSLIHGARTEVRSETMPKLATALQVSVEWLTTGAGAPPKLTGHIGPRPENLYPEADTLAIAQQAKETGVLELNNLEQAIRDLKAAKTEWLPETKGTRLFLAQFREKYRGQEADRTAVQWGVVLYDAKRSLNTELARKAASRKKAADPPPVRKRAAG
jgi:hypothetical protein